MNNNRQIYESERVVRNYIGVNKLHPAEKVIYKTIAGRISKKSMLDLGVGAGRTTHFFSPLFEKYYGVDFSLPMISACRKEFSSAGNTEFFHADALGLPEFSINKFDFVLFSLNGIDYLKKLEDRTVLFKTIYTLLEANGIFAFSTHNVKALDRLYSYQLPKRNPFKLISEYFRYKKLREINGPVEKYNNSTFCQLYDGGEYFKALTSYILPSYQLQLLLDAGFRKIQAIDINGNEISLDHLDECSDNWVHYVCYKE